MQKMPWDLVLALAKAGKSMPARIAMMAITTSSSIKVNPRERNAEEFRLVDISFGRLILGDHPRFVKEEIAQNWGCSNCAFNSTLNASATFPSQNVRFPRVSLCAQACGCYGFPQICVMLTRLLLAVFCCVLAT